MIPIADSVLKMSLIVGAALVLTALLRRQSAALRHWILAAAVASAAPMPLLARVAPAWRLPAAGSQTGRASTPRPPALQLAPVQRSAGADERIEIAPVPDPAPRSIARVLFLGWAAGAAASGLVLLVGIARLRRIARRSVRSVDTRWATFASDLAREAGIGRPVTLLLSDHPTLLVTWGVRRPRIVLPRAARRWTDDRARIVLRHELAHVARADWLIQIVTEIVLALNWFNPVMWAARRRLRRECERACDDVVLSGGVDPADYASHLLDLARMLSAHPRGFVPAPAMARSSGLEGRVAAMLNANLNHRPLTRSVQAGAVVALLSLATAAAGFGAQRFSTLSGTVVDQTNAVLPATTVVVTNSAAQARHEVRTDATGHFELQGLVDGDYQMRIEQAGFAPLVEAITVSGRDVSRAIQLRVGDLHETLTITGGVLPPPPDPELRAKSREWADAKVRKVQEQCGGGAAPAATVGGNIMAPMKVVDVKPRYPHSLQTAKVGGVVTLDALIGTDGTIRDVRVLSGDPDLGDAATQAVRQWEFSPTFLNCTAVEVHMRVTAMFKP